MNDPDKNLDLSEKNTANTDPFTVDGHLVHSGSWNGPLPPPTILKKYDEISRGYAKKSLDMHVALTKDEAEHRRKVELEALLLEKAKFQEERETKLVSLCAIAMIIGTGLLCMFNGYPDHCVGVISVTIAAVIYAFKGLKPDEKVK